MLLHQVLQNGKWCKKTTLKIWIVQPTLCASFITRFETVLHWQLLGLGQWGKGIYNLRNQLYHN